MFVQQCISVCGLRFAAVSHLSETLQSAAFTALMKDAVFHSLPRDPTLEMAPLYKQQILILEYRSKQGERGGALKERWRREGDGFSHECE